MGDYKRQHTVSKGYLRGFTAVVTPNSLWRYRKSDATVKQSSIENATVKFYAYSFQDSAGKWNHSVEEFFNRIETTSLPLLQKVIDNTALTATEREDFSLFVGTIFRRPSALIEHFEGVMKSHAGSPPHQLAELEKTCRCFLRATLQRKSTTLVNAFQPARRNSRSTLRRGRC